MRCFDKILIYCLLSELKLFKLSENLYYYKNLYKTKRWLKFFNPSTFDFLLKS